MGTTEKLCEFMVGLEFKDIPGEATDLCKKHFLDCLGTSLAGYKEEGGKIVTEYTREIGGTPESRLIGSGVSTSAANAAFGNGTMAHLLDFDDHGFSHPTASILSVLLALGEKEKLSGKEILTAQIIGYECFGKLSYGVSCGTGTIQMHTRGYHATPIWGTIAAAATASKLLGLDVEKTKMALGIAGSQAAGLSENFGTMTKGFHCGNAARAGVLAALLAKKGYDGCQDVIEGRHGLYHAIAGEGNYDLNRVTEKLGKTWEIVTPGLAIKRYPCCGCNVRAIDAILEIINEHKVSFHEVECVEVEMSSHFKDVLRFDKPTKGYQGKFSMQYNMAIAILDGRVDLDSFSDRKVNSPAVKEALSKIKVIVHPEWSSDTESMLSPVRVRMKSGQVYSNLVEKQRGHSQNPITIEELQAKYRYCAGRALPEDQVERSINMVQSLEKLSDMAQLMDAAMSH